MHHNVAAETVVHYVKGRIFLDLAPFVMTFRQVQKGKIKEAVALREKGVAFSPSMKKVSTPYRDEADKKRTIDALRKAGLPE